MARTQAAAEDQQPERPRGPKKALERVASALSGSLSGAVVSACVQVDLRILLCKLAQPHYIWTGLYLPVFPMR